ncbi:MAG TPA: UPF0158 family protein [Longimicrobium sp.]
MTKIQIDEGELLMAMDSGDGTDLWYLDRRTGAVILTDEDYLLDDESDEDEEEDELLDEDAAVRKMIDEDKEDRYLPIPSLSSDEGFRIMERFAGTVDDRRIREELFDALDRRRPFRSFKDALLAHPEVREQWFTYHENQLREAALDWLRSEEIDAELVPFVDRSSEESASP